MPTPRSALIVVDMQNDFVRPEGALPVPGAQDIIPGIAALVGVSDLVVTTRDEHPANHSSFDTNGGPWPVHCVNGTWGAQFVDELFAIGMGRINIVKGENPDTDGYSGFDDTPLQEALFTHGVTTVHLVGVALDYCVKATALDAVRLAYHVVVHLDLCRAVGSAEAAARELVEAGCVTVGAP